MTIRKIILLILCSLFFGTVKAAKYEAYGLILEKVSLSINEGEKLLLDSVNNTELNGSKYSVSVSYFTDSILSASFTLHPTHISLTLNNNTETSIYAIWSDCEFVTFNGNIFPILNSGVKLIDKEQPIPQARIRKETIHKDILTAKANVNFSSYFGRWMYSYLIAGKETAQGTPFQVILTFNVRDVEYRYYFDFTIQYYGGKNTTYFDGNNLVWYKLL